MPKLSLAVSGDGMGAKLRIEGFTPEGWRSEWAGPEGQEGPARLRAFLEEKGIAPACIREDTLRWISVTQAKTPGSHPGAGSGGRPGRGRGPGPHPAP
jgi:hypothetical protein